MVNQGFERSLAVENLHKNNEINMYIGYFFMYYIISCSFVIIYQVISNYSVILSILKFLTP